MESKDYRSVPDDEFEESYRYSGAHHSLQRTNKWGIVRLILLDQLFNTVLISILLWALLPTSCLPFSKIGILDNEYERLNDYNTVARFTHYPDLVVPSPENVHYWHDVLHPKGSGVFRFSDEWVAKNHLQPSLPTPPEYNYPSSSVYQIAVFHQLRCIQLLRQRINYPDDPEYSIGSGGYNHTPHCLDWIRQGMMCNADTTLGTTTEYINFGYGTE